MISSEVEGDVAVKRCRVVYMVHSLGVGGLERCVVRLANGLPRDRFSPAIVSLTTLGEAAKWLEKEDVELVAMNWKGGNNLRRVRELSRVLSGLGADVVHSQNWGTLLEASIGRRLAGVPVHLHTEHGQDSQENIAGWKRFVRGRLSNLAFRAATDVFVCAETNRQRVSKRTGYRADRLRYVPNGVDAPAFAPGDAARLRLETGIGPDAFVVGSVARLVPVKNFPSAVEAIAQLVDRGINVHLVLVGDGPERGVIRETSQRLGIESHVHLVGAKTDVGPWLSMFDVYVNCSVSEAMSMGVLEAMATGLPVVATNVGDNRHLVCGAPPAGLVVEPDRADELAGAIERIIQSKDLSTEFQTGARERYRREFTEDAFVNSHATAYEQAMSRFPRRQPAGEVQTRRFAADGNVAP
ncbi:MAG TPA: glycosyltransferase [Caulifigura sp.]|nr:glycosyltransferase [Caulifigura sp.]